MRRSLKLSLGAMGLAAVTGSYAFGSVRPKTPSRVDATQATAQPCTRESLTIKEGETDAAMGGVRRTPFIITNLSKSACTVDAYPSLQLLNKTGAVIKRATKEKSDEPIKPVTIEAGKTAWFALDFNAGGAGYMGKPCPVYRRIRITLTPTARLDRRSDIQSCVNSQIEVTPIHLGMPE